MVRVKWDDREALEFPDLRAVGTMFWWLKLRQTPTGYTHIVVKHSGTEGRGLFVVEDLPEGEIILRLSGRLVSTDELGSADRTRQRRSFTSLRGHAHDLRGRPSHLAARNVVHFGNHSCDPNLWHGGPFEIATRRAIQVGEELTIDYGTQSAAPGFSMACSCGFPSVAAWSQVTTGVSLRSKRGTSITGSPPWKIGLRPNELPQSPGTRCHPAALRGSCRGKCLG